MIDAKGFREKLADLNSAEGLKAQKVAERLLREMLKRRVTKGSFNTSNLSKEVSVNLLVEVLQDKGFTARTYFHDHPCNYYEELIIEVPD